MPLLEKPRRARRTVEGGCPHANLARFLWHYFQLQLVSPAQYGQRRTDAYAHLGEHAIQIVDAGYGMPLQRNDDVSFAQACALRGAIFFDPNHHRAHFLRQVVEADHAPVHGHRLRRDADVLRRMRPSRSRRLATNFAVLMPMAKQMPCAGRMVAVFTPTTRPAESTSGPPELPGFNEASV